jgi:Restriction alleviation protein Lar
VSAVQDKKPCPWCKCPAPIVVSDADRSWVECMNSNCGADGPMRDTEEQAIAAWNLAIRLEVAPGAACNHINWCPACNPTLEERK